MKKEIFALAGAALMLLSFTGCPEKKENKPAAQETKTEVTQDNVPQVENGSTKSEEPSAKTETPKAEEKTEPKVETVIYVDKYDEIDLKRMQIHPVEHLVTEENRMYPHGYEKPLIYNIGFSQDGKFAYGIFDTDDGRGGYESRFYIMDLVTDQCVWCKTYMDEEANLAEVDKAMKSYGIEYVKTKFETLPIKISGDSFDFSVKRVQLEAENEEDNWFTKANFTVTAIKNGNLKKVLGGEEGVYSYDTIVCGIIKNPYEDRVVVIVGNQEPIFEGAQYNYYLYGCDLSSNYK